ncbi:MAG: IS3 family transposase [bacterium]|nr:IS3 family transposase [bacterium]
MSLEYQDTKKALAESMGVSRAGLYYKPRQHIKDWILKATIEETLRDKPSYGHKRLALHLKINKKRVLRVMKLFGIKPYRRRKRRNYRKTKDLSVIYPNLLLTNIPSYPNHIWASDFTRINYKGKIIYLATVIDIFTRVVVGFSISAGHGTYLVINAWLSAISIHGPPEIIHSDQGSEYTSKTYTSLVQEINIKMSMSRKAAPWENGYQESFYDKLKVDLGDPNRFDDLGELIAEIYKTIHTYNHGRIHTKLKMPPVQYAILKASLTKRVI